MEGKKILQEVFFKCRNSIYPRSSNISRFPVPDDKTDWRIHWKEYNPAVYTDSSVFGKPWADGDSDDLKAQWNTLDGKVNRVSYTGVYNIVDNLPQNPMGRTGLRGRGCLGRWGPNHAADPIVTRWKRSELGTVIKSKVDLPILQFVAIQRRDCKEWAIPGGMVDPGENVSATLLREFLEEALNNLQQSHAEAEETLKRFFSKGIEIYKGPVDDPRNTDHSWMETVAVNFHDEDGSVVAKLPFQAGDDACNVRWMDLNSDIQLYASHKDFLQQVVTLHKASW